MRIVVPLFLAAPLTAIATLLSIGCAAPPLPVAEHAPQTTVGPPTTPRGPLAADLAGVICHIEPRPTSYATRTLYGVTAVADDDRLWDGAVIPFVIDDSVTPASRSDIGWAVERLNQQTVLHVRPRVAADKDFIRFYDTSNGCRSQRIGKDGGEQEIHLQETCGAPTTMHEILHAAGLYHEHTRPDRDAYVTIMWDEIMEGEKIQFELMPSARTFGAYNYESIMHYHPYIFSRRGEPTMISKQDGQELGNASDLSEGDIAGINALYRRMVR